MRELDRKAERLLSYMKTIAVADFAVALEALEAVPTNNIEFLKSSDKIRLFQIMNCDEKYKNGSASDFELYTEWERIMPLCAGHGTAELYWAEKALLGIDPAWEPREAWQRGAEAVKSYPKPSLPDRIDLNRIVSDFVISNPDIPVKYSDLIAEVYSAADRVKDKKTHVILDLRSLPYSKPDPYHAEQALEQLTCGEKNNKEALSLLLSQLLIDLLIGLKKQAERSVVLHARGAQVSELVAYLTAHRLLPGELRIGVCLEEPERCMAAIGGGTSDTRILPELLLRPSDFGCELARQLRRLAHVYPLGGMRFGGVETDSYAFAASHALFCQAFASVLAELCETEEQAKALIDEFFMS